jgi:hypothetical protein
VCGYKHGRAPARRAPCCAGLRHQDGRLAGPCLRAATFLLWLSRHLLVHEAQQSQRPRGATCSCSGSNRSSRSSKAAAPAGVPVSRAARALRGRGPAWLAAKRRSQLGHAGPRHATRLPQPMQAGRWTGTRATGGATAPRLTLISFRSVLISFMSSLIALRLSPMSCESQNGMEQILEQDRGN